MRNLYVKQKKLLDVWYENNKNLPGLGVFSLETCKEFSYEFLEELRKIHDTEIICSCINWYISDKAMNNI